jgi:integrator complex subunit 11
MVLFATPGMLHAGMSLEVFKKWCEGEKNTCILPGYCVNGTVGAKILAGERRVDLDKRTRLEVNCEVASLSFSAHADAKGIMQLISQCEPKNVMLCHGERNKMQFLKQRITDEFGIPCYDPANGETLVIQNNPPVPVDISRNLLKVEMQKPSETSFARVDSSRDIHGILLKKPGAAVQILHPAEAEQELGVRRHDLSFSASVPLHGSGVITDVWKAVAQALPATAVAHLEMEHLNLMQHKSIELNVKGDGDGLPVLHASWMLEDDEIADALLKKVEEMFPKLESSSKKPKI